jgi:dTDP-4-dehydrorhamnose reductase
VRVLVTGAAGTLGRQMLTSLARADHEPVGCDRAALDVTDRRAARDVIAAARPDAVVHCAAFTDVDAAERDPVAAFRVNADGTANVAHAADAAGARFVAISTDYVFDGASAEPYTPAARTNPLGVYGCSKLEGEAAARLAADWVVVRVSWVYGRGGRNFGSRALERARSGETLHAFADLHSVPTWATDAADHIRRLLECGAPSAIYHGCNSGGATWYDFARAALHDAGLDAAVVPGRVADAGLAAQRPRYSVMDVTATEALIGPIRSWRAAVTAAVADGL